LAYRQMRDDILHGRMSPTDLRSLLDLHTSYRPSLPMHRHLGKEAADVIVTGLLCLNDGPKQCRLCDRDMVHLESSPVSVVLEMVDRVPWSVGDQFVDLGSGLGQVPILVNLFARTPSSGIEIDDACCRFAESRAEMLGVVSVGYVRGDARSAPLQGSIYYLFTPFVGSMLDQTMARLEQASHSQPITVCSYGPCTPLIARCSWLESVAQEPPGQFTFGLFRSTSGPA